MIILTSGLTGSSVLTGLISQAGHWTGDRTHKKKDYDTFENQELIDLNLRIFSEAGYTGDYLTQFSPDAIRRITSLHGKIDGQPYRDFLAKCDAHRPWVWKDPRLWLTIRFWKNFIRLEDCRFIVLTRGFRQMWVSTTLRRQIIAYRDSKAYEQHVKDSALEFLNENKLPHIRVRYEDLIVRPEQTLPKLNAFLDTGLTMDDLRRTYHKPLYKTPGSSVIDFAKAVLIYLKNYSERIDLAAERKI